MHAQGIGIRRWTCLHRRELAVGTALVIVVALLVFAGPWLLAFAAVEWKTASRRKRLLTLALAALLLRAVVWLWRDLRGVPHGRWHPCARCRAPIEAPSQASYCSPACRRYARLERDAQAFDPDTAHRAQERLRWLQLREQADSDPELVEIPF